ncbi:hypothetical protein ACFL20_07845, partial [Spirochaetota bacterium]
MKKIILFISMITIIFTFVQNSSGEPSCLCPTKLKKCLKQASSEQAIKSCYISLKGCATDCLPKKRCMRQCKKGRKRGKKYCKKIFINKR